MKVILCGYNWVGCKVLSDLVADNNEVYVFTHENPPHINSLIETCNKYGVKYTTDKITLSNLPFQPDVICSIYYRYIINIDVIELSKGKIFNLHPSLLPKYRGCSSLTWAMINGEKKVGFSYHYLTAGIDEGNIILQKQIIVEEWDTQVTLYHRVMFESAKYFKNVLLKVLKSENGTPQRGEGDYYRRGCPNGGAINPKWNIEKIERFIRAMNYPPLQYATYQGEEVKTINEYRKKKCEYPL